MAANIMTTCTLLPLPTKTSTSCGVIFWILWNVVDRENIRYITDCAVIHFQNGRLHGFYSDGYLFQKDRKELKASRRGQTMLVAIFGSPLAIPSQQLVVLYQFGRLWYCRHEWFYYNQNFKCWHNRC